MVDITHKQNTKRTAIAQAIVRVSSIDTINAIHENKVPKGNVFEMAKAAGLLGVKKTPDLLPDCHPLPIEYTGIEYNIVGCKIEINVTVKTIYKTGVEVEAMHGASVVALTMYDMLKPIDKQIEIESIRLIQKRGGKSDFEDKYKSVLQAGVIVCSDSISAGKKQDKAGKAIIEKLKSCNVEVKLYEIIPDDKSDIESSLNTCLEAAFDIIIFTGGTGLSPRDITPEVLKPLLHREVPGIMEAARNYGQDRTPYSMLSRGVSGFINNSLVMALPGSTNGAKESMDALFPSILHVFGVVKGKQHNNIPAFKEK